MVPSPVGYFTFLLLLFTFYYSVLNVFTGFISAAFMD